MTTQLPERTFNVLVEKDEDGYYVASVVELPGCHTQAKTLDSLNRRIREAVEAYLKVVEPDRGPEFIGIQQLKIKLNRKRKSSSLRRLGRSSKH